MFPSQSTKTCQVSMQLVSRCGRWRIYLRVPDVDALIEGATGQVAPVGAEGHAVDRLLVAGQRVNAHPALYVPQPHRGVEGRAAGGGGGGGGDGLGEVEEEVEEETGWGR